jgi:hypothetical protein
MYTYWIVHKQTGRKVDEYHMRNYAKQALASMPDAQCYGLQKVPVPEMLKPQKLPKAEKPARRSSTARTRLFRVSLELAYDSLFKTPAYSMTSQLTTPAKQARETLAGLRAGTMRVSGPAIGQACDRCGIEFDTQAVRKYLEQ